MQELEERILADGVVRAGNVLKVGSFLNHQLDIRLLEDCGRAWAQAFADDNVNKILTIEASGIALAACASKFFDYAPVVFAKKSMTKNLDGACWQAWAHSYTHNTDNAVLVEKAFLGPGDTVLILDDFLARGEALKALIKIVHESGATLAGAGVAIEKNFQGGGDALRAEGIKLVSLAQIVSLENNQVSFVR